MEIPKNDLNIIINRYKERYLKYGYSPVTLGWDKGKQFIRFDILLENFALENASILDIGCGFGDLSFFIKEKTNFYKYTGIDIVPELIETANKMYASENIEFCLGDFLNFPIQQNSYDYIVGSGIFNFKLNEMDNYEYIEMIMEKSFKYADKGIAFNFLSDQVDFEKEITFHASPLKILEFAYKLSRNVCLRNDYMPFEFTVYIFKDDSFEPMDTLFNKYKNEKGIKDVFKNNY